MSVMNVSGMNGSGMSAMPYDRETFGAAVVSKTLDYMNGMGGSSAMPAVPYDKETFGAAVVSKTLDYMNGPGMGTDNGMSNSFQFQNSIMQAAYTGKGTIVDGMV